MPDPRPDPVPVADPALPASLDRDASLAATERWFLRRGIPHFIEGYRASDDIFTRALPVLSLVLLVELLGAANLAWSWWANLGALVIGAVLAVGLWAGVNRARGRRWSQLPDAIGPVELAGFVIIPALLPLIGGQVVSMVVTAVVNVALLGVIYLVLSYGLVPMTRWAFAQTTKQLGAVAGLFGRALPLLLLFTVALFINTEVWQVAASSVLNVWSPEAIFFGLLIVVYLAALVLHRDWGNAVRLPSLFLLVPVIYLLQPIYIVRTSFACAEHC